RISGSSMTIPDKFESQDLLQFYNLRNIINQGEVFGYESFPIKNLCKPLQEANQQPIQEDIQKPVQVAIQEPIQKNRDYISQEKADKWVNPNVRKSENLDDCLTLYHDLKQYDLEAVRLSTKEKLENRPEAGPGPRTQVFRNDNKSKNLINKEFERLDEIKKYKRLKKNLEFREQEELGIALKRRAIAIHRAKEFDKCGQFKFALCSLTKFLIDDKPGNKKQGKKNSRTDWLRNTQIIFYNRNEIDDYLSSAFKQILYQ
ncbi:36354_t:CDS:2, partial [Racocetra persica]